MIARTWTGHVRREDAREYVKLMEEIALPDYRKTPGNIGAWCLHRDLDDRSEIVMLTFWKDLDAIRRFAGDGETVAKYYDFDTDYLIDMPEEAIHFNAIGPSAS